MRAKTFFLVTTLLFAACGDDDDTNTTLDGGVDAAAAGSGGAAGAGGSAAGAGGSAAGAGGSAAGSGGSAAGAGGAAGNKAGAAGSAAGTGGTGSGLCAAAPCLEGLLSACPTTPMCTTATSFGLALDGGIPQIPDGGLSVSLNTCYANGVKSKTIGALPNATTTTYKANGEVCYSIDITVGIGTPSTFKYKNAAGVEVATGTSSLSDAGVATTSVKCTATQMTYSLDPSCIAGASAGGASGSGGCMQGTCN